MVNTSNWFHYRVPAKGFGTSHVLILGKSPEHALAACHKHHKHTTQSTRVEELYVYITGNTYKPVLEVPIELGGLEKTVNDIDTYFRYRVPCNAHPALSFCYIWAPTADMAFDGFKASKSMQGQTFTMTHLEVEVRPDDWRGVKSVKPSYGGIKKGLRG